MLVVKRPLAGRTASVSGACIELSLSHVTNINLEKLIDEDFVAVSYSFCHHFSIPFTMSQCLSSRLLHPIVSSLSSFRPEFLERTPDRTQPDTKDSLAGQSLQASSWSKPTYSQRGMATGNIW